MTNKEILQKLGLTSMPVEVQEQTLDQVAQVVELRTMALLDEAMNEAQRTEFQKRAKQGPDSVMKWLSEEFTEVSKIYEATLEDYLEEVTSRQNR